MTVLAFVLAYLVGAIPFGVIAGKLCGVDVRSVGSGNIGATNVYRILGPKVGIPVFLLDVLKGVAGPCIGRALLPPEAYTEIALCGLWVAVGHVFSVFLKFKGGKAIATGLGVYGALSFPVAASCLSFWGVILLITRMVSAASIAACLATPLACWIFRVPWQYAVVMSLIATVAFLKHIPNIKRIVAGTEPKLGQKKVEVAPAVGDDDERERDEKSEPKNDIEHDAKPDAKHSIESRSFGRGELGNGTSASGQPEGRGDAPVGT